MTQTPVALGGPLARRRPYLVMVDDTPILYDRMAEHYDERPDRFGPLRRFKHRINVTGLRGAAYVVPMSKWARASLVDDYGVEPSRIDVIPTGIDLEAWKPGSSPGDGPLRILFVGGHFDRKGGPVLLEAFRRLPAGSAELHLVTRTPLPTEPGVHTYHDLQPNMPELVELFRSCDVFVLPSLAEAFPNVVVEACASGLPAIVTNVGGMAEMVVDGESGFVIAPNDGERLEQLLRRFAEDPAERSAMGAAARARAKEMFDGRTNARRVVDRLLEVAPRAG
jgi:glycosyltransferase involved in cell wall biosynthesis